MRKEYYKIGTGINIKRVSANVAHKLYQEGRAIYLYPVNANPAAKWNRPCIIEKSYNEGWFKNIVDSFMKYNGGGKMGNYCKYFVEI